ncbi:sodium-dependent serotonin transporter [Toxorhynchites rutilus septentrionalis]|uniref:sodium-dependent serotonin transporter n=1 Tax=Toxorhynchites rutilus septentrionalis TaxID=329112 RepID=UPI0024797669|nr:sodium-dependent serotonin transporter [Toxorhynchites rutilus septentrionalis]XP_055622911.1 sodium-dependent serotonin transporter [Toxorhynchites rutilus septentrionalis]XP_055622912.1 sodium-dependent serotonin transporter [Toxorhynchites rutilus septentrionalis]
MKMTNDTNTTNLNATYDQSSNCKKRESWHTNGDAAGDTTGSDPAAGGGGDGGDGTDPDSSQGDYGGGGGGGGGVASDQAKETTSLNPKGSALSGNKERSLVVTLTGERRRETWGQKAEFLLAVVGFAVDLGNVWRFPYICYQNGGGAFLIPYCIMLLFGGLPLFYMELALGQFHRCGCLTIWKRICPALKGVGYAICLIDIYMGMYYNTIIGWAVYYLFASFNTELPWTKCGNAWNTEACTPITALANSTGNSLTAFGEMINGTATINGTIVPNGWLRNGTVTTMASAAVDMVRTSPAREFFERQVLEQYKSDGLDFMGPVKPSLALCVFGVFVLVYFSLWKGVRSAGKVVWVTALAPYVVLLILLARGVTLPGAAEGIRYYLTPEWHKLRNSRVWIDAASQIFFSLGPGFGTLLALSSYNKFNNNCYRDALLTSSINCLTSFLAGFVIFSVLGYMANVQNKSIEDVGLEGPGLVFIVYPEAIATMKGSVFWSIIFFLMLITLGLDSTFGGLEAMITALCDEYPRTIGRRRELFVLILLVLIFICALPTMTYGGVYLVNFLNVYGPGLAILFVVFVEAAGVFWFYGVENFSADIEQMLGKKPSLFWRICWKYISPTFLFCILIFSLLGYEAMLEGEYQYPEWSIAAGWMLTLSSVLCIPLYVIYKFMISDGGCRSRLRQTFKPEPLIPTAVPGQIYSGTAV